MELDRSKKYFRFLFHSQLYSLFLSAAAGTMVTDTSPAAWCEALGAGLQAIMRYGGAQPGDRTMVSNGKMI